MGLLLFVVFALAALAKLELSPGPAIAVSTVIGVGGLAAIFAYDLRKHLAGTLRLGGRPLVCDAWGSSARDMPITAVQVTRRTDTVMVVSVAQGPQLYIHQARVNVPLVEIEAAIFQHLGVLPGAPRPATTAETAQAYGQIARPRMVALAVGLALVAVRFWVARGQ